LQKNLPLLPQGFPVAQKEFQRFILTPGVHSVECSQLTDERQRNRPNQMNATIRKMYEVNGMTRMEIARFLKITEKQVREALR